ncbi:hypothetical protein ACLI09_16370 [Flavobacterium sp. RHBU_24]|uniref:hypothetical protein n=1 Tax=Flavobacterium sp. RHBU_24 TaxID=3391185 RepID=UPI003984EB04
MKEFKLHEGEKLKPGFSTPDNYFEGFTERLMAQLPLAEAKAEPKVVALHRRIPAWLSAAAVFIVLMAAGWFFLLDTPQTANQPDDAAIETYLVYNTNASTYDIAQQLSQQDIDNLEASLAVSDEAIEEYLLYNNLYE